MQTKAARRHQNLAAHFEVQRIGPPKNGRFDRVFASPLSFTVEDEREPVFLQLGRDGQSETIWPLEQLGGIGSIAISGNDSGDHWRRFDLYFEANQSLFNPRSLTTDEANALRVSIPAASSEEWGTPVVVVGGQSEIMLNASLPQHFDIPPQTNRFPVATSVLTNNSFVPCTRDLLRRL